MRLDEDKLETLRRWGDGLLGAGSEEQAAAGRAILMLIQEVELLRLELSRTREQWSRDEPASGGADDTGAPFESTLRGRLQRALRRESDGSPESQAELAEGTAEGAESERAITSPEAWIESLRRPN